MIDLHTHTTESDGTLTPEELVEAAVGGNLEALSITDHDTLSGHDLAAPLAKERGLELVCGIELSTKLNGRTVHLLGYFLHQPPNEAFRGWLSEMQASRRDRNLRLAARLRSLGIEITIEEVEKRGKRMAGRPHFAQIMLEKGYVSSLQEAFDEYLDESAKGYVDRLEPQLQEGIERIRAGGGISSIAHPVRIRSTDLRRAVGQMKDAGLDAIEVFHTDHSPADTQRFLGYAREFDLGVTGGSDFHGDIKPNIRLGVGPGFLDIPRSLIEKLRAL
ncbi:MAG: PHP domain-containing protein [Bryobacteraceae bacterium]